MSMRLAAHLTRTPWFPGNVAPVRPGIYEREFPTFVLFAEWTGHQWLTGSSHIAKARKRRDVSSMQVDEWSVRWRGVVSKP